MTATEELNAVCFAAWPGKQVQASLCLVRAKIGAGFIAFQLLFLELVVNDFSFKRSREILVGMKKLFRVV